MWKVSSTTFRHTQKALEKIEAYMTKKKVSKSLAINEILEAHTLDKPQSEQPQKKEGWEEFLQLPPFLYCDRERTWLLRDNLLDPHNPVGCLNSPCQKTCGAWRHKGLF